MGVTDNLGVRGEVLYKQPFGTPPAGDPTSSFQATIGLLWHMN
jgi:hypothetical protein